MKKTAGVLIGILMTLAIFTNSASAAWTYEQTFNNLNNGDLNGQDSWSGTVQYDVQSALAHEGAKAISVNAIDTSKLIERTVPSFTSGQMYFSVRRDTNSVGYFGVYLRNSTAGHVAFIYFKPNGNISAYEGVAQTERILGTYIPNTWYRIGIDYSATTDQYRANINNGAWSSWYDAVAVTSEINQIKLYADGNANSYFDFISPNYGASAPTISSVSSSNITQTTATITWTTDVQATSQVEYGPTTSYGTLTTLDSNLVYSHSVNLTGLNTDTLYHYRVKSKDAANNEAISADYTFHTAVAPLSLRLPFKDGEEWGISCGYNDQSTGCEYHRDNESTPNTNDDYYALDFNLPGVNDKGSPVLAVAPGKVETVNYCSPNCASGTYGNYVMINHGNGYKSRYAHLNAINVKVGQYVFQGEQIGTVGDTGAPNNYHLHFVLYYTDGSTTNSVAPEPMSVYTGFQSCDVSAPPPGGCYTPLTATPVAIYHFDTALDSSSNGNKGTVSTCLVAGCLGLNGTNSDYIEIPNSTSLQTASNMSVVLWLKPENVGSGRINPLDKAYFGEFSLVIENDGSLSYYHGQSTSNYFSWTALTSGSVSNNQGIRVVITRNSSTNTVKSYVNGTLISTYSGYTPAPLQSNSPLRIGLGNTNVPYKGKQDEIVIYPRVLTDDEINNDYYATQ